MHGRLSPDLRSPPDSHRKTPLHHQTATFLAGEFIVFLSPTVLIITVWGNVVATNSNLGINICLCGFSFLLKLSGGGVLQRVPGEVVQRVAGDITRIGKTTAYQIHTFTRPIEAIFSRVGAPISVAGN